MSNRVLCACECSQSLTSALLKVGIDAYSCDLQPSFGGYPERHYRTSAFYIAADFDFVFAFPPCTHLSYANGAHLKEKIDDGRTFFAIEFVKRFFAMPNLVCLENPLGVIPEYTGVKYSQIVSPDMFGSGFKKRTCLWLRGLPLLLPMTAPVGKSFVQSCSSYSFKRSILDPYFAQAMALQWHDYLV